MNDHNNGQQLRYLEEVCIPLHRAGFETQPLDESQLPVHWNGVFLCRVTSKGSVFYRREDVGTPQAEDALLCVEDIAARTLEYKDETQDDAFGWTESSMDAAGLRRENANAWKFTTLSPTDGMTDLQYLLQQKAGTVYLVMGYGSDSETSGEVPVFLLMFRLTEKDGYSI